MRRPPMLDAIEDGRAQEPPIRSQADRNERIAGRSNRPPLGRHLVVSRLGQKLGRLVGALGRLF